MLILASELEVSSFVIQSSELTRIERDRKFVVEMSVGAPYPFDDRLSASIGL